MDKRSPQKGAALLIVLMLVAVLSTMAVAITATLNRLVAQAGAAAARDNAYWALHGAEQAALHLLSVQALERKGIDTLDEQWLRNSVTLPIEGGIVQGTFKDRSACFNINHLVTGAKGEAGDLVSDPNSVRRLSLMVEAMGADRRSGEILGNSIADFIDDNDQVEPGGAEDFIYTAGDPPYLSASTRLADVSELRAVRNWTAPIYRALSPHLCVRPDNSSFGLININTISQQDVHVLFAALDGRVSIQTLEKIIEDRPIQGFESITAFGALPQIASLDPALTPAETGRLATHASYIEFSAEAVYGNSRFTMTSLILGSAGGQYTVISRRLGASDL